MALINCPECNRRISETTVNCPKCGYVITPKEVKEIKYRTRHR